MDPLLDTECRSEDCLPHPRGDGPVGGTLYASRRGSPPPAWGWTREARVRRKGDHVSPTRVGMDPARSDSAAPCPGLPHPRGDGPHAKLTIYRNEGSPPPAWGWTREGLPWSTAGCVSPTRVGMDPRCRMARARSTCLPHPRGDGPGVAVVDVYRPQSPPPAWGWTRLRVHRDRPERVSPTRVGMDPSWRPTSTACARLPHPRGDGPGRLLARSHWLRSPPPAWGWTRSLRPHARGPEVSPTRVGMDPSRG